MSIIELMLIALALSVDSFTVAFSNGMTIKNLSRRQHFTISFYLSFFQAIMPVVGYFAGVGFKHEIKAIDHWVAFILLTLLGIRMIWQAQKTEMLQKNNQFNRSKTIVQALATSVDALVIGITLSIANENISAAALIIGLVTFILSWIGLTIGKTKLKLNVKWAEIIGGLVLVFLGIKILIEHTYL